MEEFLRNILANPEESAAANAFLAEFNSRLTVEDLLERCVMTHIQYLLQSPDADNKEYGREVMLNYMAEFGEVGDMPSWYVINAFSRCAVLFIESCSDDAQIVQVIDEMCAYLDLKIDELDRNDVLLFMTMAGFLSFLTVNRKSYKYATVEELVKNSLKHRDSGKRAWIPPLLLKDVETADAFFAKSRLVLQTAREMYPDDYMSRNLANNVAIVTHHSCIAFEELHGRRGNADQGSGRGVGSAVLQHRCPVCGTVGVNLKACGKCNKVHYCSKKCQKAHWPKHKAVCYWHRAGRPAPQS